MSAVYSAEERLAAVIHSARAILGQKSFASSARAIFDQCCKLTGAVSGYVALLRADGAENELLFLEAGGMPCTVDPTLPMPIRGLREVAYDTHKAVYDNDFMNSEWVKYMPSGHVALKNVMFAPLNLDGRTVGIMGLANKPTDFTDDDAEIAAVFGDLAAIALSVSKHIDQLNQKNRDLERALAEIRTLRSILPMCSRCKNIRDDSGVWSRLEAYLLEQTGTHVSHGLCPDCLRELYPNLADDDASLS